MALRAATQIGDDSGVRRAVGTAFLYRHDHGVYIGIASTALFLITHWRQSRDGLTTFATYAGVILVVVTPFLVFVQLTIGLPWYVSDLEVPRRRRSRHSSRCCQSRSIDPHPGSRSTRRPNVASTCAGRRRWIRPSGRGSSRGFSSCRPASEGPATWSYVTGDEGHANIRALVDDPAVVDTSGIDRAAGVLASPRALVRVAAAAPAATAHAHVCQDCSVTPTRWPFFYYITLAIPLLGLLVLADRRLARHIAAREGAVAAMSVLLSLIVMETLVRGSPDSRLPDVTTIVAATGAWIAARILSRRLVGSRGRRIACR